jgi:hypothetical protein
MSTAFRFKTRLNIGDIRAPAQSVGAHLAAKLETFGSDERTLTDELCDMLSIWISGLKSAGPLAFELDVAKITARLEAKIGADLELVVSSPLGVKRCLIQAKVIDPVTLKLRGESPAQWYRLRQQLLRASRQVGWAGTYLMLYVPGGLLDGSFYGYLTYEQGNLVKVGGTHASFFGATLISAEHLLSPRGWWLRRKDKLRELAPGHYQDGVPFWQFLMGLLTCRRGEWTDRRYAADGALKEQGPQPFRTLCLSAGEVSESLWRDIQEQS